MSRFIPTTSDWVNVEGLHPVMKERLELFFSDVRVHGKIKVVSGVRTRAHQAKLYKRYLEGKGVLAANPDRRLVGGWVGSWHMVQLDGYGPAVDFRITDRGLSTTEATVVAKAYGLLPTVRGEWWHFQARTATGWFDGPMTNNPEKVIDWAAIGRYLDQIGYSISLAAIRRGSRGPEVEATQKLLANVGHDPGPADGIFGRRTRRAVRSYQRSTRALVVDGVVGNKTWTRLRRDQP